MTLPVEIDWGTSMRAGIPVRIPGQLLKSDIMATWIRMIVVVVVIDSWILEIFCRQGQYEGYTKRLDVG